MLSYFGSGALGVFIGSALTALFNHLFWRSGRRMEVKLAIADRVNELAFELRLRAASFSADQLNDAHLKLLPLRLQAQKHFSPYAIARWQGFDRVIDGIIASCAGQAGPVYPNPVTRVRTASERLLNRLYLEALNPARSAAGLLCRRVRIFLSRRLRRMLRMISRAVQLW